MTIQYNVYANDGAGGPVNYSTPIGTTAALFFAPPALRANGDYVFAVRAQDTVSGLEEQNVDARVEILTDGAGNDITNRPGAPAGLSVEVRAAGVLRVRWLRPAAPTPSAAPGCYRVYAGTPTIDYTAPKATVTDNGGIAYSADLAGLVGGSTYQVGVRAFNGSAEEPNTTTVAATADATPPQAVDGLAGVPTFQGDD